MQSVWVLVASAGGVGIRELIVDVLAEDASEVLQACVVQNGSWMDDLAASSSVAEKSHRHRFCYGCNTTPQECKQRS